MGTVEPGVSEHTAFMLNSVCLENVCVTAKVLYLSACILAGLYNCRIVAPSCDRGLKTLNYFLIQEVFEKQDQINILRCFTSREGGGGKLSGSRGLGVLITLVINSFKYPLSTEFWSKKAPLFYGNS